MGSVSSFRASAVSRSLTLSQIIVVHCENGEGPSWSRIPHEPVLMWHLVNARRFEKNFKGDALESMQERYPFLGDPNGLEGFKRKWRYLFVYAEVGYARAYTCLHRFTFTRPVSIPSS